MSNTITCQEAHFTDVHIDGLYTDVYHGLTLYPRYKSSNSNSISLPVCAIGEWGVYMVLIIDTQSPARCYVMVYHLPSYSTVQTINTNNIPNRYIFLTPTSVEISLTTLPSFPCTMAYSATRISLV